jgi:hypothetical protein
MLNCVSGSVHARCESDRCWTHCNEKVYRVEGPPKVDRYQECIDRSSYDTASTTKPASVLSSFTHLCLSASLCESSTQLIWTEIQAVESTGCRIRVLL